MTYSHACCYRGGRDAKHHDLGEITDVQIAHLVTRSNVSLKHAFICTCVSTVAAEAHAITIWGKGLIELPVQMSRWNTNSNELRIHMYMCFYNGSETYIWMRCTYECETHVRMNRFYNGSGGASHHNLGQMADESLGSLIQLTHWKTHTCVCLAFKRWFRGHSSLNRLCTKELYKRYVNSAKRPIAHSMSLLIRSRKRTHWRTHSCVCCYCGSGSAQHHDLGRCSGSQGARNPCGTLSPRCVVVCCNVLQCVEVCCSALRCVAACCSRPSSTRNSCETPRPRCVAVCCNVLQCVAVCRSVFALCCSVLQCVVAGLQVQGTFGGHPRCVGLRCTVWLSAYVSAYAATVHITATIYLRATKTYSERQLQGPLSPWSNFPDHHHNLRQKVKLLPNPILHTSIEQPLSPGRISEKSDRC